MNESPSNPIHPATLALEIFKFRKEKSVHGSNYTVRVRKGHAEIRDVTAVSDIVSALYELGYTVIKPEE